MNVVSVERREQALTVTVDSRQPTFCPECGAQSKSRHSTPYWRTLPGIYPLKERRSLFMPASGAGGVETALVRIA